MTSGLVATHTIAAGAARGSPFFMFTTSSYPDPGEREGVRAALLAHTTQQDYLSVGLLRTFPELGARLDRTHIFALPPDLQGVQLAAARGCASGIPGLIIYDGEHWQRTPMQEQADMPGAIDRGKAIASGAGCDYGVSPDGRYIGIHPKQCRYSLDEAIHRHIDWRGISLFDVQAQRLLSDGCTPSAGIPAYVAYITTVASEVRAQSPTTKIVAQFTLRYTPPDRMVAAMRQLLGIADGFYIAYPRNVVPPPCAYCSASNLDQVLAGLRSL